MWAEAGYDEFPTTWDEVEAAVDYFSEQGIDTIAFGNGGQWQANSDFLSTLGNRYTGPDWFQSLINKDGAAFTDQAFIDALTETQYLFHDTGIFNEDFNAVTNEDALGGLTRAEDVDLSAFDDVTVAFYNWTYLDTETCEIYNSYINSAVWDILDRDMQTMMNGDMTPEEVAENAQAAYEENY